MPALYPDSDDTEKDLLDKIANNTAIINEKVVSILPPPVTNLAFEYDQSDCEGSPNAQ